MQQEIKLRMTPEVAERLERLVGDGVLADFQPREQDTPQLAAKRRAGCNALVKMRQTFTRPLKNTDWLGLDKAFEAFEIEREKRLKKLKELEEVDPNARPRRKARQGAAAGAGGAGG